MRWHDEDDGPPDFNEFEWVDEDENEVPEEKGKTLSGLNRLASAAFLVLIGLFVLFLLGRAFVAVGGLLE